MQVFEMGEVGELKVTSRELLIVKEAMLAKLATDPLFYHFLVTPPLRPLNVAPSPILNTL